MDNNKILTMTFINKSGTKVNLKVEYAKQDLAKDDIVTLMDSIIAKGVITSKGGPLMFKDSAEIVEKGSSKIALR
ncbi:Protein of uncharacterised function (DUF2922) [Clostridium putrefaciens]|uniref:Protein of uncharacterized function (DUF2922) n=1 Tax=Clostridium putrefaciens TaxID=99675 RepID=A0A381J3W7_9CLOT|nr:DUF2922 domain-containing protein [Clostridium putrefaciens]SUY45216.1 Protein of uncharacterised function (DUF2922) [Clostridium putrefaciens]